MDTLTRDQVDAICCALYQAEEGEALTRLFAQNQNCPLLNPQYASQTVLMAYVYALLYSNNFEDMYEIIRKSRFDEAYFKEMQKLWFEGRYKESEVKRGKPLGPVEKYRLRRKYPPPENIWDGQETIYSFKENSRRRLKDFYEQNPYPTLEQKREISRLTDLKIIQISNWFKNRRQRDKSSRDSSYGRQQMTLQQTFPYNNIALLPQMSHRRNRPPMSINSRL